MTATVPSGPRVLFAGAMLHAEVHHPEAEVLFVTFDRWRRDRVGFADWQPSRTVAGYGFAELIIKTAHNDWYLNRELDGLMRVLKDFTKPYRTVRSFAFSMGGFAALLFSRPLRLRNAVLVSPQWSPFPKAAPFDTRYRAETRDLQAEHGDLARHVSTRLRGVVLYDPQVVVDKWHARLIEEQAPKLYAVAMPLAGHPATQVMLETPVYGKLRDLAFMGKSEVALYHALHVEARRLSPLYGQRLRERLAARAAR
ncbi:MAG: alpha/beta hydrolase [bacterium]